RGLSPAPVIHGGATNFFFAYLFIGATFIDSGKYSAEGTVNLARAHQATEMMAVPTQVLEMLRVLEEQRIPASEFAALRLIRMGGSPYPRSMVDRVHQSFGCYLLNTFGMTENCSNVTTMHTAYDPEEAWTTIGKPSYFWNARVVRMDRDEAGPDEVIDPPGRGQLIVRGPQNVERYYLSDQAPPYRQGWLYARDVVDVDTSGYMQIVDRVDETILTGGENVYPQEVEAIVKSHPLVEDAAVIGLPDPKWGEVVVAVVVGKSQALTEADIEAHCLSSGELARYKRPRRVIFVDEIPKNVFGKIERYKLRAKYGGQS
ncbi:MAG: long-chain fatty acid--CoA ligase, partial [Chloroflexota bacterium]|nr:long-chain fatty acid--CoA ligase [Chloroflexota bacterium]